MINTIIDISHWEDPIDFNKVQNDGIIAVIAKATTGATGVDSTYAKYKAAAHATGLNFLWGSYHFATGADPEEQVDNYLSVTKPTATELVALDLEPNPQGATMSLSQARDFVGIFQSKTGRYPVLYGGSYLKEKLGNNPDPLLSKCALWIAQYGPVAVIPPVWPRYTFWQYTDGNDGPQPHLVAGIGKCDRNQFDGTEAEFRAQWPFS